MLHNGTIEAHYMYQVLLPLDKIKHMYWFFSTQVLWAWIGYIFSVVTQIIYFTVLCYAAVHLQILQIRFKNFVEPNFGFSASVEAMEKKTEILKKLIQEHQQLIKYVNTVFDYCFSKLISGLLKLSIKIHGILL